LATGTYLPEEASDELLIIHV